MRDEYSNTQREFVSLVISTVHGCHSHNIPACCKRLEQAFHGFQSQCVFNAMNSVRMAMLLDDLRRALVPLRYISASEEEKTEDVKRDCLSVIGQLNLQIGQMELRAAATPEPDNDIEDVDGDLLPMPEGYKIAV